MVTYDFLLIFQLSAFSFQIFVFVFVFTHLTIFNSVLNSSTLNFLSSIFNWRLLQPEECFLKPHMGHCKGSTLEKAELKLAGEGYEWRPYNCRYELVNTEARRTCLRNANITRFMDYGDRCIFVLSHVPHWV